MNIKSRLRAVLLASSVAAGSCVAEEITTKDKLRVCADPNNLPFSHREGTGFENKIAEVLAEDMGLELEYTWHPQRMGFIRNTLNSWSEEDGRYLCDLVMGVPAEFDMSDTTDPYYQSSYVLVYKKGSKLAELDTSADIDAVPLEKKREITLGAFAPSPAVTWLQHHNLFDHAKIHSALSGDPDYYPGLMIKDDLAKGQLDGAVIWGPIGGYFAQQVNQADSNQPLGVLPLHSEDSVRFNYAIAMGVRRGEQPWKAQVQNAIRDNQSAIMAILEEYQVPVVPMTKLAKSH